MAKPSKPRVREIKHSPRRVVDHQQVHQVVLIVRGAYGDAKCQTCGRGAICYGADANHMLGVWASDHAAKVHIVQGE
jgi:hypothetical protein